MSGNPNRFHVASRGVDVADRQNPASQSTPSDNSRRAAPAVGPFHAASKSSSARATTKLAALVRSNQRQVRSTCHRTATSVSRFASAVSFAPEFSIGTKKLRRIQALNLPVETGEGEFTPSPARTANALNRPSVTFANSGYASLSGVSVGA